MHVCFKKRLSLCVKLNSIFVTCFYRFTQDVLGSAILVVAVRILIAFKEDVSMPTA